MSDAYGLTCALRIANRNPNIKGKLEYQFNHRTGGVVITKNFRGNIEEVAKGTFKECEDIILRLDGRIK